MVNIGKRQEGRSVSLQPNGQNRKSLRSRLKSVCSPANELGESSCPLNFDQCHAVLWRCPLRCNKTARPARNSVAGVVTGLVYRGEFTEYETAVADVIVRVRALERSPRYRPGDTLHVQVPAEQLFEVL